MTENKEMYTPEGKWIKRNNTLLNIEFKTKDDAKLCCKLLNQQDNDISYYINHLDEIFKWHKEHYGKSILDERLEFKSDCEKENAQLKLEIERLNMIIKTGKKVNELIPLDAHNYNKIVCPVCGFDLKFIREVAYDDGEVYLEFDCTDCEYGGRIRKGNLQW